MSWSWFPWKAIIRRVALSRGFLDPVALLGRLGRFGQPSEVRLPTELLRMGMALQARGLINNQAIQHNLDWVWPYWVEHQFDPADEAFIPRAFSLTHINLTHRNWTALGLPSSAEMPLVDPAGLVTPLLDGWSLDGWLVPAGGPPLVPSCCARLAQSATTAGNQAVSTTASEGGLDLRSRARVERAEDGLVCRVTWTAPGNGGAGDGREAGGWLVVSVRPYNPEGVSFIQHLALDGEDGTLRVDRKGRVALDPPPAAFRLSNYAAGDVFHRLEEEEEEGRREIDCEVGMATAAALYPLGAGPLEVTATVPLQGSPSREARGEKRPRRARGVAAPGDSAPPAGAARGGGRRGSSAGEEWDEALQGACALEVPEPRWNELYRHTLRAVVLHTPADVYPGPFTYKRFWFRDAAFILHALLTAGLPGRAERALQRFFPRQTVGGFFNSQEGEWDANGEVLWLLGRFCELTGREPPAKWWGPLHRGAEWIRRKRLDPAPDSLHAGLLPAGFSAEHFGPNDFYYWDDFWSVAGLRAAARLAERLGQAREAEAYAAEADSLLGAVDRSLLGVAERFGRPIAPASPYRRMDSGAIGSLAAGYPLALWAPRDERLLATVEYLLEHCLFKGAFFHDMSHSGLNPYLTLHLAQVLLRAGDPRAFDLVRTVADIASPTGHWPEAIHPRTMGGCMGDGEHIWAAAEWLLMMRALFLQEEGGGLLLGAGLPAEWLGPGARLRFGPTPTPFGQVTVRVEAGAEGTTVTCRGEWRGAVPQVAVRLPAAAGAVRLELDRLRAGRQEAGR